MSVTSYQLRAARALIDMTREELAHKADVALDALNKFENGHTTRLQARTEQAIRTVLDPQVEFLGDRGVALRSDQYRVLEGPDCYLRLLDEVYHALHGTPDAEVLSICTDDRVSPPEVVQAIRRWHEAGIPCRFLTHEHATRFDFPLREYRLIPARFFTNSVMVVFADQVATLRGTNEAVTVVKDHAQAAMLRGLFEMIWLQSPAPKRP